MNVVNLQRRQDGPRADELLDALQASVPDAERVRWNESGHARLELGRAPDARAALTERLDAIADDWPEHIAVL